MAELNVDVRKSDPIGEDCLCNKVWTVLFEDYHPGCHASHSGTDMGMANIDDRSEGKSKNSV